MRRATQARQAPHHFTLPKPTAKVNRAGSSALGDFSHRKAGGICECMIACGAVNVAEDGRRAAHD